jgi:hypothetical protein
VCFWKYDRHGSGRCRHLSTFSADDSCGNWRTLAAIIKVEETALSMLFSGGNLHSQMTDFYLKKGLETQQLEKDGKLLLPQNSLFFSFSLTGPGALVTAIEPTVISEVQES